MNLQKIARSAMDKRRAAAVGGCWTPEVNKSGECADRTCACARTLDRDAKAIDAAVQAAGGMAVERKLLAEAHAAMRACGWHLATAAEPAGDGVLEAACSEIEAAFARLLATVENA